MDDRICRIVAETLKADRVEPAFALDTVLGVLMQQHAAAKQSGFLDADDNVDAQANANEPNADAIGPDVIGRIGFAPAAPPAVPRPTLRSDVRGLRGLHPMSLLGALEWLLDAAHEHNTELMRNWPRFDHSDEAAGAAYVHQDDVITAQASLHDIVRKCRLILEAPAPAPPVADADAESSNADAA